MNLDSTHDPAETLGQTGMPADPAALPLEILIVEDSPTQAEQLKFMLGQHGYRVSHARNGQEALDSLRAHRPTLAISDINMPEMDGYELCRRIRADQRLQDLPVILLTSLSDAEDVVRGLECGADNFITKPYDEGYLISRIRYILANLSVRFHEKTRVSLEIFFAGRKHLITADRLQVFNLLLSTYETAVLKNHQLERAKEQLRTLNEELEERVKERTAALTNEIAERKRAEEALRQSQKMEAFGQLAAGIAHDFNNLLVVLQGYPELLLAQGGLSAEAEEGLKEMGVAAKRASNLTRQLLMFSRKQVMRRQSLDLNAVVGDIAKMLRRLIPANIILDATNTGNLPPIEADPGMVEQVLMNLAVNARDAMPDGGTLFFRTTVRTIDNAYVQGRPEARAGEFVSLSVRDTGCGMAPEILAHIFEPFYTTKEAGKGTGLGLATVFGIVKQHQGWIEVESQAGVGTTFNIFLPAAPSLAAAAESGAETTVRGGSETILLVEDNDMVRRLTAGSLQKQGYRVLEAASGEEAVKVWEREGARIDLLLTDMVMPGELTGRQLAEKLKATKPALKVIYTSGYSPDMMTETFAIHGDARFLQKPVPLLTIFEAVREALDRR